MAANNTTMQAEQNYDRFITELTALTRKYGVAIQSIGGVYLADESGELTNSPIRPTSRVATCTRIFRATDLRRSRPQALPAPVRRQH